jgi:multidrug efflux pump subunit AcrA (membrane-fusion protein)
VLKAAEPSSIDLQKHYDLVELIDLAQRLNPETRVAWEAARQAAIGVGQVESAYFPVLTLTALGGYQSAAFPAPKDVAPSGFFRFDILQVFPTLNLRWLLLDFGRRGNALDAAQERLLAANLGFNRKHQEVIFHVQRAFFGLTGLRAKIAVAQSAVEAALHQAHSERSHAENAIGEVEGSNARIAAAEAAVHAAELDLTYCRVRAPFTGLVVNMNISNGAFARAGVEVFTLVDTRTWYVVANFRETQLRYIPAGTPVDLYLQSQPDKHCWGTVGGLGWAVLPENGTSVNGLPRVERSLDWIRLAARFPMRIKVENPDDSLRIGASAVATVQGHARGGGP